VLRNSLAKADLTIKLALDLLDKLKDEKVRWEEQIQQLQVEFKALPINSLLTAAFVTYLGTGDEDVRSLALED